MTQTAEIAALKAEVAELRDALRGLAMRNPSEARSPWPYNIPQALWGPQETAVAVAQQKLQMQFPNATLCPTLPPGRGYGF